jgi:hypothetical protein
MAQDVLSLLRLQYNSARALQNQIRSSHAYKLFSEYKELNDSSIVLTKYFRYVLLILHRFDGERYSFSSRHVAMTQLAELKWLADEENRRRLRHKEEDDQREEIRRSLDEV